MLLPIFSYLVCCRHLGVTLVVAVHSLVINVTILLAATNLAVGLLSRPGLCSRGETVDGGSSDVSSSTGNEGLTEGALSGVAHLTRGPHNYGVRSLSW